MIAALLLAAADAPVDLAGQARALTSAIVRCTPGADATDITVCARRRADGFRVPLVVVDPGDRRHEAVAAERTRLLHRTTPIDDMGPFLVGGGLLGVTATVGGGGPGVAGYRTLAP